MKKLLSLVLICAMGFGMISCVESEESQSVADLRNAKAEQLKALTNLYNAQAEAALIVAQAEAALKAAETAYKENQTEEAKAKFAIEIEKIKAQAEAAIALAKKQIAEYEQEILADAEQHIQALLANYKSAVVELNNAKQSLITKNSELWSLEYSIIDARKNAENNIKSEQKSIDGWNARLEIWENTEYQAKDKDALWAEYTKLFAEWFTKDDLHWKSEVHANVSKSYTAADEALRDFYGEIDDLNSEFGDMFGLTPVKQHYKVYNGDMQWWLDRYLAVTAVSLDENALDQAQRSLNDNYNRIAKDLGTESDKYDAESSENSYYARYNYVMELIAELKTALPLVDAAKKAYLDACDAKIKADEAYNKAVQEQNDANALPEGTDAEKAAKKTAVEAAKKAVEAAQKAQKSAGEDLAKKGVDLNAYTDDNADDKKDGTFRQLMQEAYDSPMGYFYWLGYYDGYGYHKDITDKDGKVTGQEWVTVYVPGWNDVKDITESVENNENNWINDLNNKVANLQNVTEWKENWDPKVAELREFVAAKAEELKEVTELVAVYEAAVEADEAAEKEIDELYEQSQVVLKMYNGVFDVASEIQMLKDYVAKAEKRIEQYQSNIDNAEFQIELKKEEIAQLEAEIEILEALAENAKAALDAAISAQNAE